MNKTTKTIIGAILISFGAIFLILTFISFFYHISTEKFLPGPDTRFLIDLFGFAISGGFIAGGIYIINGPGAFTWLKNVKMPNINFSGQKEVKSNFSSKVVSGQFKADGPVSTASSSNINFAPRQSNIDEKPVLEKPVSGASLPGVVIPVPVVGVGDRSTGTAAKAKLVIMQNGQVQHEFLLAGDTMVIGRWDADGGAFPEIDLTQYDADAYVSRKHARIFMIAEGFFIEDLGSANGTFINRGGRMVPGKPEKLNDGCEVIVGKTFLKFHIV